MKKASRHEIEHELKVMILFADGLKHCVNCGEVKRLECFSPSMVKRRIIPYASYCKTCVNEKARKKYKEKTC